MKLSTGLKVMWLTTQGEVIVCSDYEHFEGWRNVDFEKHHYFIAEVVLSPLIDA